MTDLLLNPKTAKATEQFLTSPTHALIIEGALGSGKTSLMSYIATELLSDKNLSLDADHRILYVEPVNNSISIDAIRVIQEFTKLKALGNSEIKRIIAIERTETMTKEAQNALLKLLEEPPADSVILLTTNNASSLLPTIRSRAQNIVINTVPKQTIIEHFTSSGIDSNAVKKAFYISQGRVGLMSTILAEGSSELMNKIDFAKLLLSTDTFGRLTYVDALSKQKAEIGLVLQALEITTHAGMVQAAEANKTNQVTRWHRSLLSIAKAQAGLTAQANTKLLLTDLMLNL